MPTTTRKPGFYATDTSTYYQSSTGQGWLVETEELHSFGPGPVMKAVPAEAVPIDDLMDPERAASHVRSILATEDETDIATD